MFGSVNCLANYRQRLDIIADILEVISFNAKKTQIMFKANLSYKALTKYLSEVLNASLATYEQDHQCYSLTKKGNDFLSAYKIYCKNNKQIEKLEAAKKTLNDLCSQCKKLDQLLD